VLRRPQQRAVKNHTECDDVGPEQRAVGDKFNRWDFGAGVY